MFFLSFSFWKVYKPSIFSYIWVQICFKELKTMLDNGENYEPFYIFLK
jgi:hypothetical protein